MLENTNIFNHCQVKFNTKLIAYPLNDIRLYEICRRHFHNKSGIFATDELIDILHTKYGSLSLHKKSGNRRAAYRKKLNTIFNRSDLFLSLADGRYRFISSRKVVGDE